MGDIPERAEGHGRGLRFHDLVFDEDLLREMRDDGATLRLSRQERALLSVLIPHRGRLLSRQQLLSAMAARDEEESGDRNIDFIVHRLRRKLNDHARSPRFIATTPCRVPL